MTTVAEHKLPSPLTIGLSRTGLEVKQFFREKEQVIFTFLFPIMMLTIFSAVFGGEDHFDGRLSAATYFTPGMIASGIFLSSFQSLAVTIAMERDDLTLKRLRGTPMSPQSYFIGKVGLVLVTSVLQFGLTLLVAVLALGVDMPTDPARWLDFVWIFVLGAAAGSVLGIAFSMVPKSGRSASAVITPVVLVLQFISGVFFVYNELPGWMRTVAEVFPLKWLAGAGDAVGVPAGRLRGPGGRRVLAARHRRDRADGLAGGGTAAGPAVLPLDPPRRGLSRGYRPEGMMGRMRTRDRVNARAESTSRNERPAREWRMRAPATADCWP